MVQPEHWMKMGLEMWDGRQQKEFEIERPRTRRMGSAKPSETVLNDNRREGEPFSQRSASTLPPLRQLSASLKYRSSPYLTASQNLESPTAEALLVRGPDTDRALTSSVGDKY